MSELLPPCRYCKYMESMEQIQCADNCHSLDEFNDYIKSALSARDKWWGDRIGKLFTIEYSNGEIQFLPHIVITQTEWQSLRKEVGL